MDKNLPVLPHEFKVGEEVSEGFNGDWYHVGKIEKFSPNGLYLFAGGNKYRKELYKGRFKVGDDYIDAYKEGYKRVHGFSVLAKGIINKLNPHF